MYIYTHIYIHTTQGIDLCKEYPQGRYRAKRVLGSGTYGKVILCNDEKYDGTGVAIKLVRRDSAPYRCVYMYVCVCIYIYIYIYIYI